MPVGKRTVVLWLLSLLLASGAPSSHLVRELPGAGDVRGLGFDMYSGMVRTTSARSMFYWLVTASEVPAEKAPLVLWLNGGPGSSSLLGMFLEHGPHRVGHDLNLTRNPMAWNRVANLLYVDSPVGVGFSWSSDPQDLFFDDRKVAQGLLQFLEAWFAPGFFPEFLGHQLWLAGESYGGHYIPSLADLIVERGVEGKTIPKIAGLVIGNPSTFLGWGSCGGYSPDNDWWPFLSFMHERGFLSTDMFSRASAHCGWDGGMSCPNGSAVLSSDCVSSAKMCYDSLPLDRIDVYSIDSPTCLPTTRPGDFEPDPCAMNYMKAYLAQPAVAAAVHATPGHPFVVFSDPMQEHYSHASKFSDATLIYRRLLSLRPWWSNLIYSGANDPCITLEDTDRWTRCLKLPVMLPWHTWSVLESGQLGGMAVRYSGITLLAIKGAGHMVPYYQPVPGFAFFRDWVQGRRI